MGSRRSKCMEWLIEHVSFSGDECLIWPFNRVRGYGMVRDDAER